MKRILLTVVAFFYLGTSSGATVHFHYCMGKLANWGLTQTQKDNCELCGMSKKEIKKNSCCKDDFKQAKIDNSKKSVQPVYQFNPTVVVLTDHIFKYDTDQVILSNKAIQSVYSNAPPEKECIPIFIRNCTYRI